MRAGGHAFGRVAGGEHRADRKAAAERFCKRHHVGNDPSALVGEQFAGAAHAALHFVENEQEPVLIAKLAERAQK